MDPESAQKASSFGSDSFYSAQSDGEPAALAQPAEASTLPAAPVLELPAGPASAASRLRHNRSSPISGAASQPSSQPQPSTKSKWGLFARQDSPPHTPPKISPAQGNQNSGSLVSQKRKEKAPNSRRGALKRSRFPPNPAVGAANANIKQVRPPARETADVSTGTYQTELTSPSFVDETVRSSSHTGAAELLGASPSNNAQPVRVAFPSLQEEQMLLQQRQQIYVEHFRNYRSVPAPASPGSEHTAETASEKKPLTGSHARLTTSSGLTSKVSADDWGDAVVSDEEGAGSATHPRPTKSSDARHDRKSSSEFTSSSMVRSPRTSRQGWEYLKLHTDESHPSVGGPLSSNVPLNHVIGIYADPMAEKDDWADDFQLDLSSGRPGGHFAGGAGDSQPKPSSSGRIIEPVTEVMSWLLEEARKRGHPGREDDFHSLDGDSLALGGSNVRSGKDLDLLVYPGTFAGGVALSRTDLRLPPAQIRVGPRLAYGYEEGEIHPICERFLDMWRRHLPAIETHLESLRADKSAMQALEGASESEYSFTADDDVSRLALFPEHDAVGREILLWKLEYSRQCEDAFASSYKISLPTARAQIGLGRLEHRSGDLASAFEFFDAAHAELEKCGEPAEETAARDGRLSEETQDEHDCMVQNLRVELLVEVALARQSLGELESAIFTFSRAADTSMALAGRRSLSAASYGCEQRGLWWVMQCKFLLAEAYYDQKMFPEALQLYVEYAVEAIARMIGLVGPSQPEQNTVGSSLMRYCIFMPRRLALSVWASSLCLAQICAVHLAGDMSTMAMRTATALGIEDVRVATVEFCGRIKVALRNSKTEQEAVGSSQDTKDTSSSFLASFDVDGVDFEEDDWDANIAKELNITIQRCSDVTAAYGATLFAPGTGLPLAPLGQMRQSDTTVQDNAVIKQNTSSLQNDAYPGIAQPGFSSTQNELAESELRQYLNRLNATAANMSSQQMSYPKPTEPFRAAAFGPMEHEAFLREFVRCRTRMTAISAPLNSALPSAGQFSDVGGPHVLDPLRDFRARLNGVDSFSSEYAAIHVEALWRALRSPGNIFEKRDRAQILVNSVFLEVAARAPRLTVPDGEEKEERLAMVGSLLEVLRLSREILATDGKSASWFAKATNLLIVIAASVTQAAKSAVELFSAESRAHCGVVSVTPPRTLLLCKRNGADEKLTADPSADARSSNPSGPDYRNLIALPPVELRQSVVDIMHALYWRTKACIDESTKAEALERIVHADVASGLYLVGAGVSPINGCSLDLAKDESILNLDKTSIRVVDDTRRVNGRDLVADLLEMWSTLPESASLVRAKVCFALSHHVRVELHDLAHAERLLFDALLGLHNVSVPESPAIPLYGAMSKISPVAVVSSPLSCALLYEYGSVTLDRSKYRYGIAALEAAVDARKVRDPDDIANMSFAREIASVALSKYDWRRALTWLYDLRDDVHPRKGLRNEFIHLCGVLHQICVDAGCFEAALVPLRAYSALLFEEHLRSLLRRFKSRLEKKTRARKRYKAAASALPTILASSRRYGRQRSAVSPFLQGSPSRSRGSRSGTRSEPARIELQDSETASPSARRRDRTWVNRATRYISKWTLRSTGRSQTASNRAGAANYEQDLQAQAHLQDTDSIEEHPYYATNDARMLGGETSQFSDADGTSFITDDSDVNRSHDEDEREELFRIAAEQTAVADAERFEVELMKAKLSFDRGAYLEADDICRGLLEMELPPQGSRYFVLEIMARVRLKRREITRCLEVVERMEREAAVAGPHKNFRDPSLSHSQHQASFSAPLSSMAPRVHGLSFRPSGASGSESNNGGSQVCAEVMFLRLSALFHGGRLNEALAYADEALLICPEHQLWQRGKLHYMRGKVLFAMCSSSSAPFDSEEVTTAPSAPVDSSIDYQFIELTLSAFEIASGFFEAAGDEVGMVKSDLRWAHTAIDVLFRRVVVRKEVGSGMSLLEACRLHDRVIAFGEVEDVIHSALSFLSAANHPLLLIDAIAALAEVKCIQGEATAWSFWATEAWKLFSRLLTDPEEYRIVISPVASVSTLMRLKGLCGRLVRLVLCSSQGANIESINRHLCIFEAYITLQIDVDRRMNLASGVHNVSIAPLGLDERSFSAAVKGQSETEEHVPTKDQSAEEVAADTSAPTPPVKSEQQSNKPAGAFLQILSDEGIALGRQGFSVFVNRPRQQVMSAVRETGAVLIPANLFHAKRRHVHGEASWRNFRDADYIFPFGEKVGFGAMCILEEAKFHDPDFGNSQLANRPTDRTCDPYLTALQQHASDKGNGLDVEDARKPTSCAESAAASRSASASPGRAATKSSGIHDTTENDTVLERREDRSRTHGNQTHANPLSSVVEAARTNMEGGGAEAESLGASVAERVWAHMHRMKTEVRRYSRGEISVEELGSRNGTTVRSWLRCIPASKREWSVPDVLAKRLVYILYAHGVIGYYSVERGGCVAMLEFGGKQTMPTATADSSVKGAADGPMLPRMYEFSSGPALSRHVGFAQSRQRVQTPRPPNDAERKYLYGLVNDWKVKSSAWYKDRESEVVNGLASQVLQAPRRLLESKASAQKVQKTRPVVLITDLALQVIPWELFLDHVIIRSLSLLDSIRGLQHDIFQKYNQQLLQDANNSPTVALNRKIVRFINFSSARKEGGDLEQSEETRRQQLAFQSLLRMNHLSPPRLIARLELGGFSDPTALNAVARPTGPLSTPLTQGKKAIHILGMRVEGRFGKKTYSRLDFVKVAGLGSAAAADLKESALVPIQMVPGEKDSVRMELGAYIGVFLFTYADLVDVTESVFGLMRALPRGILIFTPASKMKVVARHLEDEELDVELQQASGRREGKLVPDIGASARVIVEYVSRFARAKLIPIVTFVGEGLADIFLQKRSVKRRGLPARLYEY